MRYLLFIAIILSACGNAVVHSKENVVQKNNTGFEPVAVIELFTSQGCSSCSPADAVLSTTIADAKKTNKNIFALSFHVDYWNRLGWADPFSSAAFSQRQRAYVSALQLDAAYTPQMIVNGTDECIGSDKAALTLNINKALNSQALVYVKELAAIYGEHIKVHYVLEGQNKGETINFALVSLSETTFVKRGENNGRIMTSENIVRQLITKDAAASGDVEFEAGNGFSKDEMAVIAFVQEQGNKKIIGAAKTSLQ